VVGAGRGVPNHTLHLNIQRAWHGSNLFRSLDRKIEDEICAYVRDAIPEAKPDDTA
jgi:hypothetical protein